MTELEKLFHEYINRDDHQDRPEALAATLAWSNALKHQLSWNDFCALEALILDSELESEKQGFINGFRYAVALLTDRIERDIMNGQD